MQNSLYQPVTPEIIQELIAIVGDDNVSSSELDRRERAYDVSGHPPHLSEVVVWPETAAQIARLLRLANEAHIPVTPWGAGTSVEGNPIPLFGGILLSTERMQATLQLYVDDLQVTVEAGVKYKQLNQHLEPYGLFFPPNPGGDATIGGMLANNAAGAKTVKYGACKDNVLQMQVALADGRLIEVGSRSIKQSSGYDLLHLFVGSEGTLGIITRATLKLMPIPKMMSAVVASFETVEAAVKAVVALRRSGLDLGALEFIDAPTTKMLNRAEGVGLAEHHTLFMEFHAPYEVALEMGLETVREICEAAGSVNFRATTEPKERERLWYARYHAYTIAVNNHPEERLLVLDTAVPISAYPAIVAQVQASLSKWNIAGYLLGHAGDGNMHVLIPYTGRSYEQALAFNEEMVLRAIELGGTATGEHGVGIGKKQYMQREHGPALEVMRSLKRMLDPNNILNPGKIFPET
jgi:D-lactate dehydrogenase (cytochrome)